MGLLLMILINVELICGVVCKIETGLNLFPFSSPILGWDIAGTHMVISTNTPVGHLEFYDFDTSYLTALPWPTLGGIVMVSTHESNKNNSYCMIYQLSNSSAQRISANSSCTNGTNYSFNVMLSSWGFGQDVDAYYLSYPANPGSNLLWGVNVTYTNSTFAQGYEVTYQQYYNNTIFYVARSLANSQSMNLVIYVNSSGIIQPNSSFLYPDCPAMTIDVYLEYLAVKCGNYV